MSRASVIDEVAQRLRTLSEEFGGIIAGFWIRPDPYLDQDVAVVLMLVDFIGDDEMAAENGNGVDESVAKSVDVCDRVAEALEPVIASSCWFTTESDFVASGPPLDPTSFERLEPTPSAA